MNRVVHHLSENELTQITTIYEKKIAYENLAKILSIEENEAIYNRLITDYGATVHQFEQWWDKVFADNNLPNGQYTVDFTNGTIVETVVPQS